MHTLHRIVVVVCCIFFVEFSALSFIGTDPAQKLVGNWQGGLQAGGRTLRIVFRIQPTPQGTLGAVMDSPDQGVKDYPTDSVIIVGDSVNIVMKSVSGGFSGRMKNDSTISGAWSQGPVHLPLDLFRRDVVARVNRPQEPHPPYPYAEEEVLYPNPAAGSTLGATVTFPKTGGPFPAVLLITGSGQQNRDEELLGHKPFLVLADYLTRQGFAVMRVDDRGIGKSTGNFALSTTRDFAGDVKAGIAYLKTRKEIDPKKIGLLGHSEGGIIAPMVASEDPSIAFIVMMAGSAVRGDSVLQRQRSMIFKAGGSTEEFINKYNALFAKMETASFTETDSAGKAASMRAAIEKELPDFTTEERSMLKLDSAWINGAIRQTLAPWFQFFLQYDPSTALRKVHCPVLAINGSKDFQVPPDQNLPAIERALKEADNKDYTIKEFPGLNHLFQPAATGSPTEYASIEITIDPPVLAFIGDWITAKMK